MAEQKKMTFRIQVGNRPEPPTGPTTANSAAGSRATFFIGIPTPPPPARPEVPQKPEPARAPRR
jgi:hypothetical protein